MATAEQIKTLIRSHFSEESDRFFTAALQVAAHEARQGHSGLAHEIKTLVDKARQQKKLELIKFPPELSGLILTEEPKAHQENLILSEERSVRIQRILHEYKQRNALKSHGLSHRRKILISGLRCWWNPSGRIIQSFHLFQVLRRSISKFGSLQISPN